MYFGHKHIETGPNFSYELATFLKYHHMPFKAVVPKKCVLEKKSFSMILKHEIILTVV